MPRHTPIPSNQSSDTIHLRGGRLFRALAEVFGRHGLPLSLYTDRGSHSEILCVQEERQVGNDNCVAFNRLKLQIPGDPLRPHFVKARAKVRQYHDGMHAIFHGPRCLGRYDQAGVIADARKAV